VRVRVRVGVGLGVGVGVGWSGWVGEWVWVFELVGCAMLVHLF